MTPRNENSSHIFTEDTENWGLAGREPDLVTSKASIKCFKLENVGPNPMKTVYHSSTDAEVDKALPPCSRRKIRRFRLFCFVFMIAIIIGSAFVIGGNTMTYKKVGEEKRAASKPGTPSLPNIDLESNFSVTSPPAASGDEDVDTQHPAPDPSQHIGGEEAVVHLYDAIVVGAGWAGLKAVETLLADGVSSVLVLEANDYIGGRARTINGVIPGVPIDLGCEWLYKDGNEDMASVINNLSLVDWNPSPSYDPYDTDSLTFYRQSINEDSTIATDRMSDADELEDMERLWSGESGFRPFAKKISKMLGKTDTDESYADALDEYESERNIDEEEKQFLDLLTDANLELEHAGEDTLLSVKDMTYYGGSGRMKYVSVPGAGFGNVATSFSKAFESNIKLNAKVTEINHEENHHVVISFVENGVAKKAITRTALVTVSLGVLKAGSIKFIPSLPQAKQDAIDNMGFGHLNKCIMYWEEADDIVWPVDKSWIELITPDDESSGKWTSFFNPTNLKGVPMLQGFIGGRDAAAMEDQTDEEVLDDVMKNLSAMFPSITRPKKIIVTRWGKDENIRGSYSFQQVGRTFHEDAANLQERTGSLWFAGEVTSGEGWHATTIGGWMSGEKAAKDMTTVLKENKA
jgi:monoamine oxidase